MTANTDNSSPALPARFEGVIWLVAMCLVSAVSAFPAELPSAWLMLGVGLVALLRMGGAAMPYVVLASLLISLTFCIDRQLPLWVAARECALMVLAQVFQVWFSWRAVVWLQNRRSSPLLSRAADVFPFVACACLLPPLLMAICWFALVWMGLPQLVSSVDEISIITLVVVRNAMGLMLIGPLYWVVPRLRSTPLWVIASGWLLFSLPVFLNEEVYFGLAILAYPAAILVAKTLRFNGIAVAVAIASIFSLGYTYHSVAGNELHLVANWLTDTVLFSTTLGIVALYSALSFEELEARGERLEHLVAERTSDLQQANQRLTEMASVDPLTGLANRRQWNSRAELSVAQSAFTDESLSVLLVDLDHFKSINDNYGHDIGDAVLRQFSHRCHEVLRSADTLARLGGEEFALMLQGADLDVAAQVANKLLRLVRETPFGEGDNSSIGVTISIGVAEWRPQESSLSRAMKRADQALYQAKRNGRNRVVLEPNLRVSA